jgi:hypothetical protein
LDLITLSAGDLGVDMERDTGDTANSSMTPRTWHQRLPTLVAILGSVAGGIAVFSGNVSTIRENIEKFWNTAEPKLVIREPQIMNLPEMQSTPSRFWVEVVVDKDPGPKITNCVQWIDLDGYELRAKNPISFDTSSHHKVLSFLFSWDKAIFSDTAKFRLVCDQIVTPWELFSTVNIRSTPAFAQNQVEFGSDRSYKLLLRNACTEPLLALVHHESTSGEGETIGWFWLPTDAVTSVPIAKAMRLYVYARYLDQKKKFTGFNGAIFGFNGRTYSFSAIALDTDPVLHSFVWHS